MTGTEQLRRNIISGLLAAILAQESAAGVTNRDFRKPCCPLTLIFVYDHFKGYIIVSEHMNTPGAF